jgi:hypothetical protein
MQKVKKEEFSTSYWPGCPPIRDENETAEFPCGIGQKSFVFDLDPGSDDDEEDIEYQKQKIANPSIEINSNFCSGNIKHVELDDDSVSSPKFSLYTAVDCEGEDPAFMTTYRTWFYFAVRGAQVGQTLTFTIMNMNKQTGLFGHDHRPSMCCIPSAPNWSRMTQSVTNYKMVDGSMELKFKYEVVALDQEIRFSFCFPLSYWEVQKRFEYLEQWFVPRGELLQNSTDGQTLPSPGENESLFEPSRDIYYHRELLSRSIDGRRLDIITITSRRGLVANKREVPPSSDGMNEGESGKVTQLFKEHRPGNSEAACGMGGAGQHAHHFVGRPIVYISSRVHPGETPASHMFEGILRFLLKRGSDDPRAAMLRRKFVFKLVPILNPDGVSRGHYRADTRGVNLNRRYKDPNP